MLPKSVRADLMRLPKGLRDERIADILKRKAPPCLTKMAISLCKAFPAEIRGHIKDYRLIWD